MLAKIWLVGMHTSLYLALSLTWPNAEDQGWHCRQRIFTISIHDYKLWLIAKVPHEFGEFCEENSIDHVKVTAMYKQANSQVDAKTTDSIFNQIRNAQAQGQNRQEELRHYVTKYCTTRKTTAELFKSENASMDNYQCFRQTIIWLGNSRPPCWKQRQIQPVHGRSSERKSLWSFLLRTALNPSQLWSKLVRKS